MSIAEKLTTIAENEQKVYEAGKKSEYDRFWDIYQDEGNPMRYYATFSGAGWTDENFKPKYNIVFNSSGCNYLFQLSKITEVNVDIDTRLAPYWHQIAYGAARLKKIQKIILKEDGSQTAQAPFESANRLEYIRFEGKIGVSVSFSSCPLDLDSAKDVIEHLMDYSGTSNDMKYTITFSATTKALLNEDNSTWTDDVTNKGWNV